MTHQRKIDDLKRSADLSQCLLIDRVVEICDSRVSDLEEREAAVAKDERWIRFLADQIDSTAHNYLGYPGAARFFGPHFVDRCRERFPG